MLALLKAIDPVHAFTSDPSCNPIIYEMLYHACEVEIHDGVSGVALLDELHQVLTAHRNSYKGHETVVRGFLWQYQVEKFVTIAVKAGLHKYVAHNLAIRPQYLRQVYHWPLLALAVESPVVEDINHPGYSTHLILDADMARILLHCGADPNGKFLGIVTDTDEHQYCIVWKAFSISLL